MHCVLRLGFLFWFCSLKLLVTVGFGFSIESLGVISCLLAFYFHACYLNHFSFVLIRSLHIELMVSGAFDEGHLVQ